MQVFGAFTRALRGADLEKCEEYLRRDPGRQRHTVVPDLQIGTALQEREGMRSDRSHSKIPTTAIARRWRVWRAGWETSR